MVQFVEYIFKEAFIITQEEFAEQWELCYRQANHIISEIKKVVLGKDEIIIKVLLTILAKGHVLIEDIPGVGKTTLAMAFSKALSLEQRRMQFTPDVLPTDVTGFSLYNKSTNAFEYKPGAVSCNLFLADEINRTSPKTQSALLEVMEEGRVTVDGITRELPAPFIVIATQNPSGSIGTQMLPESQLDRFMVRLSMGYPDAESEMDILRGKQKGNPLDQIQAVADADIILQLRWMVEQVYIDDKILQYIVRLVHATRDYPLIKLGVSPRGTVALTAISRAAAFLRGRDYVIPADVAYVLKDVLEHRIVMASKARLSDVTTEEVIAEILNKTSAPVFSG